MSAPPPLSAWDDAGVESIRTPPFSSEAEEAVIGGLLIDPDGWDKVADLVEDKDFYKKRHQILFRAISDLAGKNEPFDAVTLSDYLTDTGLKDDDILDYLVSLTRNTPSSANIRSYAGIVHDKSIRRRLIAAASTIIEKSFAPAEEGSKGLLDEAEQSIFELSDSDKSGPGFVRLIEVGQMAYEDVDKRSKLKSEITGVPTGFSDIDKNTSGLQAGDLIIIAGRPGMGKTSLAMNIVQYASMSTSKKHPHPPKERKPIAIFSLEMSAQQLALRFLSSLGGVNQHDLRRGDVKGPDWGNLTDALKRHMQDANVYIDDSSSVSALDVRARSRRIMREHDGLSLIVIDYLQLMNTVGQKENRVLEIASISRSLKSLAKELDVPVVVLSQLNRAIEMREDKRPVLSDLRESGAIEQDADLILFIYTDEKSDKDNGNQQDDAGGDQRVENPVFKINAAKQRNGPQFQTKLVFERKCLRFRDLVEEDEYKQKVHPDSVGPDDYGAVDSYEPVY